MSEQIDTYTSTEFGSIRALRDENGEPWFVASDIAKALGYDITPHMTRRLDDDEKGIRLVDTPGGTQNMTVITEAGLYTAILGSKVEGAQRFKRWVTHEVLPSIRKHGGYLAGQEHMTTEQMVLASMRYLESKINEQQAQLEAQKPKVLFADAVGASDGTCLVGELAKMLTQAGYTVGQNRLFRQLRDDGFLGKIGQNRNVPLQRWVEQGLFRIKETAITHPDGHVTLNRTTKVTGKGQRYLIDYYTKGKAIADATVE